MSVEGREDNSDLAKIKVLAGVSVVIPTYKEAQNIPLMLGRISRLRDQYEIDLEVLFMDDDSADGSIEAVAAAGHDWARIVVRKADRGLSPAVIEGFRLATKPVLVCMDGDLSHPPEIIPQLVLALAAGAQFALGSRYVTGGSTNDDWGVFRWLNSRVATLLARPLTSAKDPMSGFFALRKTDFDSAHDLNAVGYKIALELIVKCGFDNVAEIPILFVDRIHGESKLTMRQQLLYIMHLRRLYIYKSANAMAAAQFAVVGASGVVVNLAVLTLLERIGAPILLCLIGGIVASVCTNFALNRRFTFSYARNGKILKQFAGFVSVSALGVAVNLGVSLLTASRLTAKQPLALQLAALVGIACGLTFNYLGNRYVIFRKTHIRG
nr:glycosyltransferase family 2 protein [uncultured Devosia sp.]